MSTLRELDVSQRAMLRQVVEGKLTFRARHSHGPHYVWGADSPMPRTAYAAEIATVQVLIVKGLLVAPDPLAGAQLVEPTPLGQSLYRQIVGSAVATEAALALEGEPGSLEDRLGSAVWWARMALEAIDARELTDAQVYARTQLAAGLELLKAAHAQLVPR